MRTACCCRALACSASSRLPVRRRWRRRFVAAPGPVTPARAAGFLFCAGVLAPHEQRLWCERCLGAYVCGTNAANTDAELGPLPDDLWDRAAREGAAPPAAKPSRKRPLGAATPASPRPARAALAKLRWVTLGYHYDWTRRVYHAGRVSPFPADLAALSEGVARELGLGLRAEAAIVNFYHPGHVMGGHQDELELTHEPPVVSLSLGLTCVFLLGSARSKDDAPAAVFLRSGDVVLLAGDSRLAYHGAAQGRARACARRLAVRASASRSAVTLPAPPHQVCRWCLPTRARRSSPTPRS